MVTDSGIDEAFARPVRAHERAADVVAIHLLCEAVDREIAALGAISSAPLTPDHRFQTRRPRTRSP